MHNKQQQQQQKKTKKREPEGGCAEKRHEREKLDKQDVIDKMTTNVMLMSLFANQTKGMSSVCM